MDKRLEQTFSKEDMQMDTECLAKLLHGIAASAYILFSHVTFRDHKFCLPMNASPCPRLWPQTHKPIQVLIWFPQQPVIRSALRPSVYMLYVPLTYNPWEAYKNHTPFVWINQSIFSPRNPKHFTQFLIKAGAPSSAPLHTAMTSLCDLWGHAVYFPQNL